MNSALLASAFSSLLVLGGPAHSWGHYSGTVRACAGIFCDKEDFRSDEPSMPAVYKEAESDFIMNDPTGVCSFHGKVVLTWNPIGRYVFINANGTADAPSSEFGCLRAGDPSGVGTANIVLEDSFILESDYWPFGTLVEIGADDDGTISATMQGLREFADSSSSVRYHITVATHPWGLEEIDYSYFKAKISGGKTTVMTSGIKFFRFPRGARLYLRMEVAGGAGARAFAYPFQSASASASVFKDFRGPHAEVARKRGNAAIIWGGLKVTDPDGNPIPIRLISESGVRWDLPGKRITTSPE